MKVDGTLLDLKSRGFVVVRDVFDTKLLATIEADARRPNPNGRKFIQFAPDDIRVAAQEASQTLLGQIREQTGIGVSMFEGALYFHANGKKNARADGTGETFDIHTDRLAYYLVQDFSQYLNFWFPIVKPDPTKSGLVVIPRDVLKEKDPSIFEATDCRGAAEYLGFRPNGFEYEADGAFKQLTPQVDLNDLAIVPSVSPGDVLLVRGDVLHGTQDNDTDRIALSIRAINPNYVVKQSVFLTMSKHKYDRLLAEAHFTATVLDAFGGQPEVRLGELVSRMAARDKTGRMPLPMFCNLTGSATT